MRTIESANAIVLVTTAFALSFAPCLWAHDLNLFATGNGERITGRAYFPDDEPAAGVRVQITGPSGENFGEIVTNHEGRFDFKARYRCDHHLVSELVDGHREEFTVPESELSMSLPALASGTTEKPATPTQINGKTPEDVSQDRIRVIVEEAVGTQIAPLREQIDAYEHRARLHDVVGGIGYILGMAGLVVLMKRRSVSGKSKR